LTTQLSPALLKQLKEKKIDDFPYSPNTIRWEGKFLQVDGGVTYELMMDSIKFTYNKKRNEALNTHRFFSSSDINGIVWIETKSDVVGQYDNGGNAYQQYYVISFLDLKQKVVLAQDTIWGGMPPKHINTQIGFGKEPAEKAVIELINERTKN